MLKQIGVHIGYGIAQFLCVRDIHALKATAKLGTFDVFISANTIWKFWYVKKTQEWMNRILRQCLTKHPFYNRTSSNIDLFNLPCSLDKAPSIPTKRRFVVLNDFLRCPECNYYDVDCALWFSVGHRMAQSDPYVMFLCSLCAEKQVFNLFDYFHPPMISHYGEYVWVEA